MSKLSFENATDYYRKDFYLSYENNKSYFDCVGMPSISTATFYRWKKDKDAEFKNFKKMFDKGLFEKYYIKNDMPSEEEEEEEEPIEEEKEEEKPYTTDLERDIYMIFQGVSQPHHIEDEYMEVLELWMLKELKTFEDYKKWKEEQEDDEPSIYPSDEPYDPNWQEKLEKDDIHRECKKIVKDIIEDAIKNAVPPITKEDEDKKECDRCCEWVNDYTEFKNGECVCSECWNDIEVLQCIATDYYNLKNNIYKIADTKFKEKMNTTTTETKTGKKKKIKKGAKCDGHNPNKSNEDEFNDLKCNCRIWNEGYGGQCSNNIYDKGMCKSHYNKSHKFNSCMYDGIDTQDEHTEIWWFGLFDDKVPNSIRDAVLDQRYIVVGDDEDNANQYDDCVADNVLEYLPKSVVKGAVNKKNGYFKWK